MIALEEEAGRVLSQSKPSFQSQFDEDVGGDKRMTDGSANLAPQTAVKQSCPFFPRKQVCLA